MSVYFVVQEEVHDQEGLNEYMEAAKNSTLGDGRALVVDNNVVPIEGGMARFAVGHSRVRRRRRL